MDGTPDAWGMNVNPVFATTAAGNTNGVAFGDPLPESFPKSDPRCFEAGPIANGLTPPPLCGPDWMPFVGSWRDSARAAATGTDGAKVQENVLALTIDQVWKRTEPQAPGRLRMLTVTDTAFAQLYGLQAAKLSRAGDDGTNRTFVAPDADGLLRGLDAMRPSAVAGVLEPDATAAVAGAYPLTSLTYGIIRPLALDDASRADYANFVDYAVGPGQVSGLELGQLPPGYVPLPDALKAQGRDAAETIRTLPPVPDPPVEATTPAAAAPVGGSSAFPSRGAPSPSSSTAGRRSAPSSSPVAVSPVVDSSPATVSDVATAPTGLGPLTPILALARSRYFMPVLAGIGVLAALLALEITKRPRRASNRRVAGPAGASS